MANLPWANDWFPCSANDLSSGLSDVEGSNTFAFADGTSNQLPRSAQREPFMPSARLNPHDPDEASFMQPTHGDQQLSTEHTLVNHEPLSEQDKLRFASGRNGTNIAPTTSSRRRACAIWSSVVPQ